MKHHTNYNALILTAVCCMFCHTMADAQQTVFVSGQHDGAEQQTPDTARVWTLRDCMEYAVSNSTQIRIQQAKVFPGGSSRNPVSTIPRARRFAASGNATSGSTAIASSPGGK